MNKVSLDISTSWTSSENEKMVLNKKSVRRCECCSLWFRTIRFCLFLVIIWQISQCVKWNNKSKQYCFTSNLLFVGKPTEVFLDIYVESFGNIKEVNMVRSLFDNSPYNWSWFFFLKPLNDAKVWLWHIFNVPFACFFHVPWASGLVEPSWGEWRLV